RGLFAFGLALILATAVSAEEKKKDEPKKPAVNPIFTFNKNMKPAATEEQTKKLEEIQKEYAPKLSELQKKIAVTRTRDRVKAANEAAKGKKGKEAQEARDAALKWTDDEKKQLGDLRKEAAKVNGEITKKKMALLTDEQKTSLKPKPKKDSK